MTSQPTSRNHIETTELLVRLYVFLNQYLDRCINEAAHQSYPESELKKHLAETRARLSEILTINSVVKNKVEQECDRVLTLGAACLKGGGKTTDVELLKAEQAILRNKTIALSDLLAVFRAV
ncbi:MAG: hypothetical protein EXR97_01570 [Nitrospiraceae bacterium]|nr:hypothetical protein [Nitrospiraceae bacterium]